MVHVQLNKVCKYCKQLLLFALSGLTTFVLIHNYKQSSATHLSPDNSLESLYQLDESIIKEFEENTEKISVPKFTPVASIQNGHIQSPFKDSFLFDKKYSVISEEQLFTFIEWWKIFIVKNEVKHVAESFDCDNFAPLFKAMLNLTNNHNSENDGQIFSASIIVEQKKSFAFVPSSDTWHMLNAVFTDNGWYVIEPQNGLYTKLDKYPNEILLAFF